MQPGPPPWGQPPQQWGPPQPQWVPPTGRPPRKSIGTGTILLIVGAMGLLAMVGAGVAGYMLVRKVAATLDPNDVPRLMRAHVPCKECKVSNLSIHGNFFSVSVQSEEDEKRTLVYRVYEGRAELAFSQSWGSFPPAWFDYKDVDWPLASELKSEMNRKAIRGRSVDYVAVVPCEFGRVERPARACMEVTVLTAKGDLTKKIDAATGKTEDAR